MGTKKQAIALAVIAATGTVGAIATQADDLSLASMVRNYKEIETTEIKEVTENGITMSGTIGPDGALINYKISSDSGITDISQIKAVTWTNNGKPLDVGVDKNVIMEKATDLEGTIQFVNFNPETALEIEGDITFEELDTGATIRKNNKTPKLSFTTLANSTISDINIVPTLDGGTVSAKFVFAESTVTNWYPEVTGIKLIDADADGEEVTSTISGVLNQHDPIKTFDVTGLNPGTSHNLSIEYKYTARKNAAELTAVVTLGELTTLSNALPVTSVEATVSEVTQTGATISGSFVLPPNDSTTAPTEVTDVRIEGKAGTISAVVEESNNKFMATISGLTPGSKETYTITVVDTSPEPDVTKTVEVETLKLPDAGTVNEFKIVEGTVKHDSADVSFTADLNPKGNTFEPDVMTVSAGEYLDETNVVQGINTIKLTNLPVDTTTTVTLTFTHSEGENTTETVTITTSDVPFAITSAKIDKFLEDGTTMLFTLEATTEPETDKDVVITAKTANGEEAKFHALPTTANKAAVKEQYKITGLDPDEVYTNINVTYGGQTKALTDINGNEIDNIHNGEVTLITPDNSGLSTPAIIGIVVGVILIITIPIVIGSLIYKKRQD